jgi:hypothetical protein
MRAFLFFPCYNGRLFRRLAATLGLSSATFVVAAVRLIRKQ